MRAAWQQLMEMHSAMVEARKEIAELRKEREETEAKEREMVDTLASTGDKVFTPQKQTPLVRFSPSTY